VSAFQRDAFQLDAFEVESLPAGTAQFSARAVLLGTLSGSFTADAVIVDYQLNNCQTDDFSTLDPDWGWQQGNAYVSGGVLVVDPEDVDDTEFSVFASPKSFELQFDFWVPNDVLDGYHYYEMDVAGRWFLVDNDVSGGADATHWTIYSEAVGNTLIPVTGDTWYTYKARGATHTGAPWAIKVWEVGDPEPAHWNLTGNYTSPSAAPNEQVALFISAATNHAIDSVYPSKMDNVSWCEFAVTKERNFTADAVFGLGGWIPSDAVLKDTIEWPGVSSVRNTTTHSSTSGRSKTINRPTYVQNDLLLAYITDDVAFGTAIITPPAGWSLVATDTMQSDVGVDATRESVYSKIATGEEPSTYTFDVSITPTTGPRTVIRMFSVANARGVHQVLTNSHTGDGSTDIYEWTAPEITTQLPQSLVFASWHGGNFLDEADVINPTGSWTEQGNVVGVANAWVKVYTYSATQGTVLEPEMGWPAQDFTLAAGSIILEITPEPGIFTADAQLRLAGNVFEFTADAVIEKVIVPFTADAIIKRVWPVLFRADAYLIALRTEEDFTADSVIKYAGTGGIFTANAVLKIPIDFDAPRLTKSTTMTILQRRPLEFDIFVPPKTPDEDEQEEQTSYCVPPCAGVGAGGSMNGWGSFKIAMTQCVFCDNYFRTDSEFLGRGSGASSSDEHCGFCGAHFKDSHRTRLWVNYPSLPSGQFKLRAKLTWDLDGPDAVTVGVYNVSTFPDTEGGGCEDSSFDGVWSEGLRVGNLTFVNDGNTTTIGGAEYKYQNDPAEAVIDAGAMGSSIFRFQVDDEDFFINAKFRSASLEWPE
jgi:hypothetical protein